MNNFEGENNIPDLSETAERKRVNALRPDDKKGEDSVWDLAKEEDAFRSDLTKKSTDELADQNSDKILEIRKAKKEALEAKKEMRKAKRARWKDELTGLFNRNACDEEVPRLISMESRQEKPCAFLMIDFDHFKDVNDTFGHKAGDQALRQMANTIKNELRRTEEVVYRIGGEEFLVFLPGADKAAAEGVAGKIRKRVAETPIEIIDKKGQKILLKKTVSIGCVSTDNVMGQMTRNKGGAHKFMETMLGFADQAVYKAKEVGRNKVVVYGLGGFKEVEEK